MYTHTDSRYTFISPTISSLCREGTMEFIEEVGLSALVDIVVCGDDQVEKFREFVFFQNSLSISRFPDQSQTPITCSTYVINWAYLLTRLSWWVEYSKIEPRRIAHCSHHDGPSDYSDDDHVGDVVEVGDTPADTVMGRAAGLGLTVGVLRFFTSIVFIISFQSTTWDIILCYHFYVSSSAELVSPRTSTTPTW